MDEWSKGYQQGLARGREESEKEIAKLRQAIVDELYIHTHGLPVDNSDRINDLRKALVESKREE